MITICLILIAGTMCTVGIMYRADPNDSTMFADAYRKVAQDYNRTTVSTYIQQREDNTSGGGPNPSPGPGTMPGVPTPTGPTPTPVPGPSSGPISGLNYQPIMDRGGLKYQEQSGTYWNTVKGCDGAGVAGAGSTFSGEGCYLYALMSAAYNKYGVDPKPGNQFEDVVVEYCTKTGCTWNANGGKLTAALDSNVGYGNSGNYKFGPFIMNKFGISYTETGYASSSPGVGWPTDPGEYIVYFKHPSNFHWVYIEVDASGNITCGNSGRQPNEAIWVSRVLKLQ